MSATHEQQPAAESRRAPDPGEPVPAVAWPTVALFFGAVAVFSISTALAVAGAVPWPVSVVVNFATSYMFFTVLHDASHRSLAKHKGVNEWFGRASGLFVAPPFASLSVFRYIHLQHHRFTNHDASRDPDAYTTNGARWTWPLRWATLDLRYYTLYFPQLHKRPRREQLELVATGTISIGAVVAAGLAGYLAEALVLYVLPTRLNVMFLGFAFDFLPHHGLGATPEEDRFRTTRNRVGLERLLSPVLLYQNYHLVHHLHPRMPFYRYLRAWRRNEEEYLAHDPPLSTVAGRAMTTDEYRTMRGLSAPGAAATGDR